VRAFIAFPWFLSKVKEKEKWYFKRSAVTRGKALYSPLLRLAAARWANQNSGNSSKSS
jgi:hypothetical protein